MTTLNKDWLGAKRHGGVLRAASMSLELPQPPKRFFHHGWQSWSLATWAAPAALPIQKPALLHPLQVDPEFAGHRRAHSSWVGAVEMDDARILLLGALGLDAHVELEGNRLRGWYTAGAGRWFIALGTEQDVFARYARALRRAYGPASRKKVPRVWSSWYSLYAGIDEGVLHHIFEELGDLPFDVLQVDDGWERSVGDWQPGDGFPSGMKHMAQKIKATGRKAGLWLAPLVAVGSSRLFREHPDWFLHDDEGSLVSAGFNWGEPLFGLDTTHEAARAWLRQLMEQVRAWGFDYLKLDFLYAGALPGKRAKEMPREAAYRSGLELLRSAMGTDAYFVACGAPILPSLGMCDALRVGPDVAGFWENHRDAVWLRNLTTPGARNSIRTVLHRMWLKPLVQLDPDVAYFRSVECALTSEQKSLVKALCLICGFKSSSDLPQWLTAVERRELETFLRSASRVEQTGRYRYRIAGQEVDFSESVELPAAPNGLDSLASAFMGWLSNQGWALRAFDALSKNNLKRLRNKI